MVDAESDIIVEAESDDMVEVPSVVVVVSVPSVFFEQEVARAATAKKKNADFVIAFIVFRGVLFK